MILLIFFPKRFVLLTFLGLCASFQLIAQKAPISHIAAKVFAERMNVSWRTYTPFHTRALDATTSKLLPAASQFSVDTSVLNDLLRTAPRVLELIVPTRQGDVRLKLIASEPLTDEFQVIAASTGSAVEVFAGLHYVGIVNDDPNLPAGQAGTLAAISIFPDQVMGIINDGHGDHVLGPMENSDAHIYYAAQDLHVPFQFVCDTPDDPVAHPIDQPGLDEGDRSVKCVRFYWEVNNDIFVAKGSLANTVNYVTALFNQSAALYANDGISVTLNSMYVWDVASPYTGTTMLEQLTLFQNTRNTFNGDLAHLIGLTGGGGRAASLAGLCNGNNDNSMCYSNVTTTFLNIPTYSWSVQVVSHEQGHLLGSNHTHACAWNGNNTQIDGCGPSQGYSEGACAQGPIPSGGVGGTIMSYCHLVSGVGINFLNGFGPQPLAVILNSISAAPCLINCSATGCGPVFTAPTSNITSASAQLNWMPITSANSYKLQWKPVSSPTWTTVSPIIGTSYALPGLSPWTSYSYQVKTNCTSDTSAYSPITTFTTAGSSLSDGLVACYAFNNSPNDGSGNGHNGVLFGPVPTADRYGVPNAAYYFDGVSNRIDVADLNTFPISTEISMGFWVKTLESKGNAVLWAWPDIGTDRLLVNPNFLHGGTNNDFSWDFGNATGAGHCTVTNYPFRPEWEYYVVTSSALSNSMKSYRNGVLLDEEHHSSSLSNLNRTLCIGGNGSPAFFLHGSMDDITIHNRELTAGEVMQLYTSGTPCAQRITVAPKVFLEGPYVQASQLMSDALRSTGLVPAAEPYTGTAYPFLGGGSGTVISAGVTASIGNSAVCDWVVVELRQPASPYAILATRTALVQRDGDVVGMDGASPVAFDAAPGNYSIAIHHRNHLGVMTGAPVALTSVATSIDFANTATATYGTSAQKQVGTKMVMWAGDTNGDGTLKYTGINNDRDPILVAIGGSVPTNTLNNVYDRRDVNMDGVVRYTGASNDRDPILVNIGGTVPTNTRVQQLP